jgi:hypothetical protein
MSEVSDAFRRIERPNVRTNTSVQPLSARPAGLEVRIAKIAKPTIEISDKVRLNLEKFV